jgi:hypothetical protein
LAIADLRFCCRGVSAKVFSVAHKGYQTILQIENRQWQIKNASGADR